MKYLIAVLFGLVALVAVSLIAFLFPFGEGRVVGLQMRQTVAVFGFSTVGMLYIAVKSIERIWQLFQKK